MLHIPLLVFRKVTEPKLLSDHMGLSTLMSLVSMFVGMQLSGVLGLILGPIAVVVLQSAWHGKVFENTLLDMRCVIAHIRSVLSESCETPASSNEAQATEGQNDIVQP